VIRYVDENVTANYPSYISDVLNFRILEFIVIIIKPFVMCLLQLKNECKRYLCYGKIDKKRLWLGLINIVC